MEWCLGICWGCFGVYARNGVFCVSARPVSTTKEGSRKVSNMALVL